MSETNETTDRGWIKIHRSIRDHWIWQDPVKLKWWLDILMEVNHSDNKVNLGLQLVECKRGQSVMSLGNWANRWGVSKNTVKSFFLLLEKDKMITHENVSKSTRITVCNYGNYQDVLHDGCTMAARWLNTNKNDNNNIDYINNNLYRSKTTSNDVYEFDSFWDDYDKKVGNKTKLRTKWDKLSKRDKLAIKEYIPKYKKAQPDKRYRKNPETFLNNKSWNDEIIISPKLPFVEQPTKRYRNLSEEFDDEI